MLRGLVKTLRPHQWVKNLFVLAPMFFAKDLFLDVNGVAALNLDITRQGILATFVFCLLAGAVYTINDLADVEADRVHPVKRNRPIASGRVPGVGGASVMAGFLVVASLGIAVPRSTGSSRRSPASIFVENLAYSFGLKKVAFLDVRLIAFGFVLRVVAGGFATHTAHHHPEWTLIGGVSPDMLACTATLLALFLGFGKRRHEPRAGENAGKQRATLEAYSPRSLNIAALAHGPRARRRRTCRTTLSTRHTREFFHFDYLWITVPFTVLRPSSASSSSCRGAPVAASRPSRRRRRCSATCPSC